MTVIEHILSLFDYRQVPCGPLGVEDERVAAAAMKQLEMLMPNFSGANAAASVKSLKRTLYSCCFCNACCPLIASSGRARLRRPIVVGGVDRRVVTLAPGPKNARERSTPSSEGNGLLAGAIVHPAHLVGASVQGVMVGGKHL